MRYLRYAIYLILFFTIIIGASAIANAQPDPETVKKIRQLEAENTAKTREIEQLKADRKFWKASSDRWEGLYTASNENTDENLVESLKKRDLQNANLRTALNSANNRVDSLERDVRKWKGRALIGTAVGAGVGFGAGYALGSQKKGDPIVVNNIPQPQGFRVAFRF